MSSDAIFSPSFVRPKPIRRSTLSSVPASPPRPQPAVTPTNRVTISPKASAPSISPLRNSGSEQVPPIRPDSPHPATPVRKVSPMRSVAHVARENGTGVDVVTCLLDQLLTGPIFKELLTGEAAVRPTTSSRGLYLYAKKSPAPRLVDRASERFSSAATTRARTPPPPPADNLDRVSPRLASAAAKRGLARPPAEDVDRVSPRLASAAAKRALTPPPVDVSSSSSSESDIVLPARRAPSRRARRVVQAAAASAAPRGRGGRNASSTRTTSRSGVASRAAPKRRR